MSAKTLGRKMGGGEDIQRPRHKKENNITFNLKEQNGKMCTAFQRIGKSLQQLRNCCLLTKDYALGNQLFPMLRIYEEYLH
jgi:hypothetical protein